MKNLSVICVIVFCVIAFFSQRTFALSFSGSGSTGVSYTGTLVYDGTSTLTVTLTNTTASTLGGAITSFGFHDPFSPSSIEITDLSFTGSFNFGIAEKTQSLDFGATTDPFGSLFGGTTSQGLAPGDTSIFTLELTGNNLSSLTASSFLAGGNPLIRFQGIGPNDLSDKTNSNVPVPSTMLLLGTCMLGFVVIEVRRRISKNTVGSGS